MDRREKVESRLRRKKRIRKKVSGTAEKPRLCVFKSLKNMYAQIVDDSTGKVITGASTLTSNVKGGIKYGGNVTGAKKVGESHREKGPRPGDQRDRLRSERVQVSWQGQGSRRRRPRRRINLLEEVGELIEKRRIDPAELELVDRVVHINRVAKVVKGGRRFSFSAIVVVGDGKGHVGFGLGKANEVPDAIRKAVERAKKGIIEVPINRGTVPYEITGMYGSSQVFIKPAYEGTGVIAGGTVRAVVEVAGIRNIFTKCYGSRNPHNVVKATLAGTCDAESPDGPKPKGKGTKTEEA